MSFTQVAQEEPSVSIIIHNTNATYTRDIQVSLDFDLRQQVYKQAAQDLRANALPNFSDIILTCSEFSPYLWKGTLIRKIFKGSEKNTSIGQAEMEGTIHALCSVTTDLPSQPPTLDDPDLDHSEYKEVLRAIMDNKFDMQLDKYREEREILARELQANIGFLRTELDNATRRQIKDKEVVLRHMEDMKQMFRGGGAMVMESH